MEFIKKKITRLNHCIKIAVPVLWVVAIVAPAILWFLTRSGFTTIAKGLGMVNTLSMVLEILSVAFFLRWYWKKEEREIEEEEALWRSLMGGEHNETLN